MVLGRAGHGRKHLAHIGIASVEILVAFGGKGQSALDMTLDILPGLAGNSAVVQLNLRVVGDHVSGGAGNAFVDADSGHAQLRVRLRRKGQIPERFYEARHLQQGVNAQMGHGAVGRFAKEFHLHPNGTLMGNGLLQPAGLADYESTYILHTALLHEAMSA